MILTISFTNVKYTILWCERNQIFIYQMLIVIKNFHRVENSHDLRYNMQPYIIGTLSFERYLQMLPYVKYRLNNTGDIIHPCLTPLLILTVAN